MERVMGRQTDQQRGPTEWGSTKRNMISKIHVCTVMYLPIRE